MAVSIDPVQVTIEVAQRGLPGRDGDATRTLQTYQLPLGADRLVTTTGYADNTLENTAWTYLGISTQASPGQVYVAVSGEYESSSWAWTPNSLLFVGTNGLLTDIPPGPPALYSKVVAFALTPTKIQLLEHTPTWLTT